MSAAKKFRGHYPKDGFAAKESAKKSNGEAGRNRGQSSRDKAVIEQYVKKIETLLKDDPAAQKKAANILEALINSSGNSRGNS